MNGLKAVGHLQAQAVVKLNPAALEKILKDQTSLELGEEEKEVHQKRKRKLLKPEVNRM